MKEEVRKEIVEKIDYLMGILVFTQRWYKDLEYHSEKGRPYKKRKLAKETLEEPLLMRKGVGKQIEHLNWLLLTDQSEAEIVCEK